MKGKRAEGRERVDTEPKKADVERVNCGLPERHSRTNDNVRRKNMRRSVVLAVVVCLAQLASGGMVAAQSTPTPPQICATMQSPSSVTATYPVWVTSTVTDNRGLTDVTLTYDAGSGSVAIPMLDDGLHDDGAAGDHVYGAQIPGAPHNTTVTYYITATDDDAAQSTNPAGAPTTTYSYVVGCALNDLDCDGDVDVDDFNVLDACTSGPGIPYSTLPSGCLLTPDAEGHIVIDADEDGDVDQADFGAFQVCYSGEGIPADPTCPGGSDGSAVTYIVLNGTSITADGTCVTIEGTKATITCAGTYNVSGSLADGQIIVNTQDQGVVRLVLNGVGISNSTTAPIYVMNAAKTDIVLADQSVNYVSDPASYVFEDPLVEEPNAAVFSHDLLTISGTGSLTVHGNYNDAIASKDGLIITSGTITVTSVDDGIRGKDYLIVDNGSLAMTVGGDGLKSDNAEDASLGYVSVADGTINAISGGDGIAAETDAVVGGGNLTIVSGGGHTVTITTDLSAKGIKGTAAVVIEGGTINVDAADDGIHSNGSVTIGGATLTVATNSSTTAAYGDAIYADSSITIASGTVTVTSSYEGIESPTITISDGEFHITSSDDAITAATTVSIAAGTFDIVSGGGHTVTIGSTASAKGIKGLSSVIIGGGTFTLDCADDGIHSNGAITIGGGTFTIATNSSTTASYGDGLHADGTIRITGGTITVTTCFEGIEAPSITVDNGNIHITSTDDGINAAGGPGLGNFIYVNGGYVAVNAAGDGIDANGSITMTGGTVIVHGPTREDNSAIDYDGTFKISGGVLVAAGSAGMAQAPSTTSTQRSVKITYASNKAAATLAHIQKTTGGTDILTFSPAKTYRSLVFSAPTLTASTSFDLYTGGSSTGTVIDGLYQGGTYTPGTKTNTFTTTSIVTNVNAP